MPAGALPAASLLAALALAAPLGSPRGADEPSPPIAERPGIYFEGTSLCSLEDPRATTSFARPAHLPKTPSLRVVLSRAAAAFGIDERSLLLIERRLGGIILIEVPIAVTPVAGREATYDVVPEAELRPDDYAFAVTRDSAITFFGCGFTTLPASGP